MTSNKTMHLERHRRKASTLVYDGRAVGEVFKFTRAPGFGIRVPGIYWLKGEPSLHGGGTITSVQRMKDAVGVADRAIPLLLFVCTHKDRNMSQYARRNAAHKIEGYRFGCGREPHLPNTALESFERAKAETLVHMRKALQDVEDMTFDQFCVGVADN